MKYCIFKRKQLLLPLIFPDCVTHAEIKIEGAELISAGFCNIDKDSFVWVDMNMKSESTGKSPREEDQNILQGVVWQFPTSSFLDFS